MYICQPAMCLCIRLGQRVSLGSEGYVTHPSRSHTGKDEEEVLKPRNASVIAVDDSGRLGLRHEGTLAECKFDEWHEYFTVPQFEQVCRRSLTT